MTYIGKMAPDNKPCNKQFVELFNKLTFDPVFTRIGVENQMGQDWDLAAQPAPDYEVDQRLK